MLSVRLSDRLLNLDRSRRQHWDVSLIANVTELPQCQQPYDHLSLAAVVEFGLNCDLDHLKDAIQRLSHHGSNLHQGFISHLFGLFASHMRPSARDWSPYSVRLHATDAIQPLLEGTTIEVYLGVIDPTNANPTGLWKITSSAIVTLATAGLPAEAAGFPEEAPEDMPRDL